MNPTLKNTLMALATAALGLGSAAGCSDKSSETPEAESSSGGEATGGEASCSGEGSCSAEHTGGGEGASETPSSEPPPMPEGEAPPSP
ncbi:MAG TPA: hypothetical protein VK509_19450 [Polyangiales bacterium]|nr:hypothetical protein [Polyangiales bacterium]